MAQMESPPPPCFLKENAPEISKVLTGTYQDCINTGTVPSKWKHANLCAIHEKGKKSDPSNYRPVSLTCIGSKVLEHIVHSHVMNHLWQYGVLTDNQHVFRAKRSTETQFICTIHEIASAIQSNKTTHTVVLDFSKAFVKLPYRRLLTKLGYYGIRGSLLNRFESFLTQCTSVPVPVQGPHLLLESRHLASERNGLRAVTVLNIYKWLTWWS